MSFQIPNDNPRLTEYNNLRAAMANNPEKYDFDSTELRTLKPRYNDKTDGLEHDAKMYLEEENNLFHASIITMTTLLFASIYISSSK
jgi:hypothetical protein